MEPDTSPMPTDLGGILARLAETSSRPRYAYMVLGLIAEAAASNGRAGPFITADPAGTVPSSVRITLRDWLAGQLIPLAARDHRRSALRARVAKRLGARGIDTALVEAVVEEEALAIGKANVSRAVSDLVRAGLVRRHYAGRVTDHTNRGGRRLAVYAVEPPVLNAIRSRPTLV